LSAAAARWRDVMPAVAAANSACAAALLPPARAAATARPRRVEGAGADADPRMILVEATESELSLSVANAAT